MSTGRGSRMAQFDKEIGKYVGAEETNRLKQYVFIPLDLNTATDDAVQDHPEPARQHAAGVQGISPVEDEGAVRQGNRQIRRSQGNGTALALHGNQVGAASRVTRLQGRYLTAIAVLAVAAPAAAAPQVRAPEQKSASGEALYRAACVTCHGPDGKGSPRTLVGFDVALPDFTDCSFASAEADADWFAVIHEGGPVRGLDRHMPAFGSALTPDEITLAANHVRTFCTEPASPRGDLNLPRAMFTEKAFPENEALWVTRITRGPEAAMGNDLIYERRIGARTQFEIVAPIDFQQGTEGSWTRGLGDVAFAVKRRCTRATSTAASSRAAWRSSCRRGKTPSGSAAA